MNDWKSDLMQKHNDIFADRTLPMSQTCMCWGLEVGDGWRELLEKTCAKLELVQKATGVKVKAEQVKSKFATLRFYYSTDVSGVAERDRGLVSDLIDDIIHCAESCSEYTCELCGEEGRVRGGVWVTTLCWKCAFKAEDTLTRYEQTKLSPDEKQVYAAYINAQNERREDFQKERDATLVEN